ncbi:hypothetical protein [Nocardioides gilvus]|uniref:hypothetical protein n=1 Tax=Nocardioides gilvus TaxID=1735589 RepID=UPI000D747F4D|nr:hypothetical protein [Nocardioides gilvus]
MNIQGPATSPVVAYIPLGVGLAMIAVSNLVQYLQMHSLGEYGGYELLTIVSTVNSLGMVIGTLGAVAVGIRIGLLSLRPAGGPQL